MLSPAAGYPALAQIKRRSNKLWTIFKGETDSKAAGARA